MSMQFPRVSGFTYHGDIVVEPPGETTQRYLILISKIMTSVANETLPGSKEVFMGEMKDFIIENQQRLKSFYESLGGQVKFLFCD